MNKVYLIIAESDLREDGYYILPGSTSLEETEKILNNINKLLDYILNHSSVYNYFSEEVLLKDIEYFEKKNPGIEINKSSDLLSMLEDSKDLGINWEFTIKKVIIQ